MLPNRQTMRQHWDTWLLFVLLGTTAGFYLNFFLPREFVAVGAVLITHTVTDNMNVKQGDEAAAVVSQRLAALLNTDVFSRITNTPFDGMRTNITKDGALALTVRDAAQASGLAALRAAIEGIPLLLNDLYGPKHELRTIVIRDPSVTNRPSEGFQPALTTLIGFLVGLGAAWTYHNISFARATAPARDNSRVSLEELGPLLIAHSVRPVTKPTKALLKSKAARPKKRAASKPIESSPPDNLPTVEV